MKLEIEVCDFCRDPQRPVNLYTVGRGGKQGELAACQEHAAPLEGVLAEVEPPRRRPRARRGGIEVTPLEAIG